MTDEPVASCRQCSEPVERVFHPVAVHFKGSGFYTTDYGRNRGGGSSDSRDKETEPAASKSEGSESEGSKSEGSKSEDSKSEGSGGGSKSEGSKS